MMATKKTPAKKAIKPAPAAKNTPVKARAQKEVVIASKPRKKEEELFTMPVEVRDWIEKAHSIMNRQRGEIERLKDENTKMKAYKRWAENRILRSDHE